MASDPMQESYKSEKYRRRLLYARNPTPFFKAVQLTTWVLCGGVGIWCILFQDWGERQHVFSPIRQWMDGARLVSNRDDIYMKEAQQRKQKKAELS